MVDDYGYDLPFRNGDAEDRPVRNRRTKSRRRLTKKGREKPILQGKLLRTQRLILAAVRLWELKRGLNDL